MIFSLILLSLQEERGTSRDPAEIPISKFWLSLYVCASYTSWSFLLGLVSITHASWLCFFWCQYHHRLLAHSLLLCIEKTLYIGINDSGVVIENSTVYLPPVDSGCLRSFCGYIPALHVGQSSRIFPVCLEADKTRISHACACTHICVYVYLYVFTYKHTYIYIYPLVLWWKCAATFKLKVLLLCVLVHTIAEASLSDRFFWPNSEMLVIDGQCFEVLPFIQFKKSASCFKINSYDITLM